MTTQSIVSLLRKINRDTQPSIVGSQINLQEAEDCYAKSCNELEHAKSALSTIEEMVSNSRSSLQQWHVSPSCTRDDNRCKSGQCGCSYGDLVCLSNLLQIEKSQRHKIAQIEHHMLCYRCLVEQVIGPKITLLCQNYDCVLAFVGMAYLTNDITDDDWWIANFNTPDLALVKTTLGLRLTLGTDTPYSIYWDNLSNRIS